MDSSKNTISWLIAVIVGVSLALVVFFATGGSDPESKPIGGARPPGPVPEGGDAPSPPDEMAPGPGPSIDPPDAPTALEKLDDSALQPAELMEDLRKAIAENDARALGILLPEGRVGAGQVDALRAFLREHKLRLNPEKPIVEVGEAELNRRTRWGLNLLDEEGREYRLTFDLEKGGDQKWRIGKIRLPDDASEGGAGPDLGDALSAAEGFLRSTLAQEFEKARFYVAPETVSDATIAGVCILFEEGAYELRAERPIRNLFLRDDHAGFVAKVESKEGGEVGDIGMTLRKHESGAWRIRRIALDTLLRDYAARNTDGDIYYTPLVRNPEGGSSIALYFAFDNAELSERSRRQLKIVAGLLKVDPAKTIKISGHADALGSEDYNLELSRRRAAAVRATLIEFGVAGEQIEIEGLGQSQPRRPNFLEDGRDNERGRRANRRAEIYLDF